MNHFDDNMGRKFMDEFYGMFQAAVYNSEIVDEFEERWHVTLTMSGEADNIWL